MNTAGKPIEVSVSTAREPTEASIGTLVHRLVDDGKAYALAEIDVVKSMATERVNAAKTGVIVGVAAIFVLQAGLTVLFVGLGFLLAELVGLWFGVVLSALIALGLAGAMAYYAATHITPADSGKAKEKRS
jgi:hypothetical protein